MVNLDFRPTFTATLLRKDFDLGLAAAREREVPLPVAGLVHQLIQGLVGRGYGDQDFAALITMQADSAGVTLASEDVPVSDGLEPQGLLPGGLPSGPAGLIDQPTLNPGRTGMRARQSLRQHRVPFLSVSVTAAVVAAFLAGCSGSSAPSGGGASAGGSPGGSGSGPVVIGTSLSLTGDFSADGQAFKKGYEFWAARSTPAALLLGARFRLKILNDNSSPTRSSPTTRH
jgi:hypothetical protein